MPARSASIETSTSKKKVGYPTLRCGSRTRTGLWILRLVPSPIGGKLRPPRTSALSMSWHRICTFSGYSSRRAA